MSAEAIVVDYGMGNLHSVEKALVTVGAEPLRTSDPEVVAAAERLVLPGVAFGEAVRRLHAEELWQPIVDRVEAGVPLLGICLGHQLLFEESDEMGEHEGFGFLEGRVERLPKHLRIPHIGWNEAHFRQEHPLLSGLESGVHFYFVHSYVAAGAPKDEVLAETDYEDVYFPSIVARGNIAGVQFHPEKSQRKGLRLLESFVTWTPGA